MEKVKSKNAIWHGVRYNLLHGTTEEYYHSLSFKYSSTRQHVIN
jgi:hypothetical protein